MPPFLALLLWFVCLLGVLLFDPAKVSKPSLALWVPLVWMFIIASRLPSQWLEGSFGAASESIEEGNPLDRAVFALLILVALAILMLRSFRWGDFFARNMVLVSFLLFGLMSVLWSDFPFVSFKRWFRDFGDYLAVLIVLSDPHPLDAFRTVLRRLCYLLIPLSILVIKYYPQIGKQYEIWSGSSVFVGVTTSKNMLGVVCLIGGIYFFWDTLTRWPDRKERRTKRIILMNGAMIGMTLWLLKLANSATSKVCLALGCLVIAAAHTKFIKRNPVVLKTLIPVCFLTYMFLETFFDINAGLAGAVGRNATLTGRTDLWKLLLSMHINPLLGTGYESFWLGPRLTWIYERFAVVNEAHNGYLETYLNLGLVGLSLLVLFLISRYRNICRELSSHASLASLSLALWTVLLFYNVTEAAFKCSQLMWLIFLLGVISVSGRVEDRAHDFAPLPKAPATEPFPVLPLEPTSSRR